MPSTPSTGARRLPRAACVGSTLTAMMTLALLGGTLSAAVARPVEGSPLRSTAPLQSFKVVAKAGATRIKIGKSSLAISGTNVPRSANKLVVYKAPRSATPKAKRGVDAVVVKGRVTIVKIHTAKARGRKGVKVPRGGYALSGLGSAATWLRTVAKPGITVSSLRPTTSMEVTTAGATPAPANSSTGTTSSAPMALPTKVQAVYYMMWSKSPQVRLKNLPAGINVVNLAFIQGTKLVDWGPYGKATTIADARLLRARGVRVIASVGGAGGAVNLADRAGFVAGVKAIRAELPLDGIDWDVESDAFKAADVIAISRQLKKDLGSNFAITMAPNGSNVDNYLSIAVQLNRLGALDMYGQQFYDAVVSKEAAKHRVAQAVSAGLPQSKLSIGMMVGTTSKYWTVAQCLANVRYIKAAYPGIRGGYLWEAGRAGTADWASQLHSLLRG